MQLTVYISCYVEAQNRDAFMAVRQDLMLAFIDCVHRNRAELARTRLGVSPKLLIPLHGSTLQAGNVASIRVLAQHQIAVGTYKGCVKPDICIPSALPACPPGPCTHHHQGGASLRGLSQASQPVPSGPTPTTARTDRVAGQPGCHTCAGCQHSIYACFCHGACTPAHEWDLLQIEITSSAPAVAAAAPRAESESRSQAAQVSSLGLSGRPDPVRQVRLVWVSCQAMPTTQPAPDCCRC